MGHDLEQDHYGVLGVAPSATSEDVKAAFRGLAKRFHPDLHQGDPGAHDRFKKIVEAHATLSDPARRAQYDRDRRLHGFSGFRDAVRGGSDQAIKDMAESLFQDFLKRDGGKAAPDGIPDPPDPDPPPFREVRRRKGKDTRTSLSITLEEAVHGVEKSLESPGGKSPCSVCHGKGGDPLSPVLPCATCSGSGQVLNRTSATVCKNCRGYRTVSIKSCRKCLGRGTEDSVRRVRFKVPSGVEDGTELRLAGMGEPGEGGPGDLYVTVRLQEHEKVARQGRDLHVTAEVPIKTALLGGKAQVELLGRTVEFDVSPSSFLKGETQVVRGGGIRPQLGAPSGDLYIRVTSSIGPATPRATRLIEELDEEVRSRRPR